MDTNRLFKNLFSGGLTAPNKAATATIDFTKSTAMPAVSNLTLKAALSTGKALVDTGYKLTDCCTSKSQLSHPQ